MHNHDDKYPARPGFEPGTSRLQAPVDTNVPAHMLSISGLGKGRPIYATVRTLVDTRAFFVLQHLHFEISKITKEFSRILLVDVIYVTHIRPRVSYMAYNCIKPHSFINTQVNLVTNLRVPAWQADSVSHWTIFYFVWSASYTQTLYEPLNQASLWPWPLTAKLSHLKFLTFEAVAQICLISDQNLCKSVNRHLLPKWQWFNMVIKRIKNDCSRAERYQLLVVVLSGISFS